MPSPEDSSSKNNEEKNRHPWRNPREEPREEEKMRLWGILVFGLIGATATTLAVGQLRKTAEWFYSQLNRSQSYSSGKGATGGSKRSGFKEDAWNRYNRRMQEEYEEEMERVVSLDSFLNFLLIYFCFSRVNGLVKERIRRMQSVFNRERNKHKHSYESWREHGSGAYQQYQHFQRDDWYWKTDTSYKDRKAKSSSGAIPRDSGNYSLSHHYTVLGLDRSREKSYSEAEIKTAFRAKAKEFHPDQNQNNKEAAEAKFKEVMISYEAIKSERKDGKR